MHTSASCLVMLLWVGLMSAAPPSAPPRSPVPDSWESVARVEDAVLPAPRVMPRSMPTGTPGEEPAPAPHELTPGPIGLSSPGQAHEETAPMPREQTPPPPRLLTPDNLRTSPGPDVDVLHREIESLRMEREAMLAEEIDLVTARDLHAAKGNNSVALRRRITELLAKTTQRAKKETIATPASPAQQAKSVSPPPTPTPPTSPTNAPRALASPSVAHSERRDTAPNLSAPGATGVAPAQSGKLLTDMPVDPLSLAQSLFLAGDYSGALSAYRKLEQEDQKGEDRVAIQYMTACCLRKLGKRDEASLLYREVANSGDMDILVENAQWYLRSMKERRELEEQLDELRQRRQTLMPRKP